jgi:hypothetical protein
MNSPLDPALEPLAEVLRHSFAQAQDELEIDTSALVQKLEEEEPDKFVANAVNTPWNEYFRAVLDRERSDLTVESTILKLAEEYPYWKHLLSAQLDRANRWLVLGERLRGAQRFTAVRSIWTRGIRAVRTRIGRLGRLGKSRPGTPPNGASQWRELRRLTGNCPKFAS